MIPTAIQQFLNNNKERSKRSHPIGCCCRFPSSLLYRHAALLWSCDTQDHAPQTPYRATAPARGLHAAVFSGHGNLLARPGSTGFVAYVDHPEAKYHHRWGGCFHGRFEQAEALPNIFHPRHQRSYTMPAAPLEVRAFMEMMQLNVMAEWLLKAEF